MRFLFRVAVFAAVFLAGSEALRRWLEQENAAAMEAHSVAPPPAPDPRSDPGPPTETAYDSLSQAELYRRAQAAGIKGRSKMSKAELAEAVAYAELAGG